jgi:hypothetical protein
MPARSRRAAPPTRLLAALLAALLVAAALPSQALAEGDNPWKVWASELGDRGTKAEIPVVVLVTLPAMLVITPFWLGGIAYGKIKQMAGGGGGEDDAEGEEGDEEDAEAAEGDEEDAEAEADD